MIQAAATQPSQQVFHAETFVETTTSGNSVPRQQPSEDARQMLHDEYQAGYAAGYNAAMQKGGA